MHVSLLAFQILSNTVIGGGLNLFHKGSSKIIILCISCFPINNLRDILSSLYMQCAKSFQTLLQALWHLLINPCHIQPNNT